VLFSTFGLITPGHSHSEELSKRSLDPDSLMI